MVKRLFEDKRVVFLAALLALTLLASALNNITFRPAQPLFRPAEESQTTQISMRQAIGDFLNIPLWKQIAFFTGISLISLLTLSLLSPEMRKRLLAIFIRAALSVILIYYLFKIKPDLLEGLFPQFNFENAAEDPSAPGNIAPPVFEPPQISSALSFFITLVILLAALVIAWRVYLWWQHQNELLNTQHPLGEIARIARASLRELSAQQGAARDAIIQCYEKMSQAVVARRGLQRNYAATAAEFAQRLENAGLPREPVERLTRLFESARYSAHTSTQSDIDEAVSCLTSILIYCGETP